MKIAEVAKLLEGRRLARQAGRVIFTVYTDAEAETWRKHGASVETKTTGGFIFHEVLPSSMLDPMPEVIDGQEIDNRTDVLYEWACERDGYTWPARAKGVR